MSKPSIGPWQEAVDGLGRQYFFRAAPCSGEPHLADAVAKVMPNLRASVRFRAYDDDYSFGDWANWGEQPEVTSSEVAKLWCDEMLKLLGYTLK